MKLFLAFLLSASVAFAQGTTQNISQFVSGSPDCGIQEAMNAAPATGAHLYFDITSCTITSPQTVTMITTPTAASPKPLYIDGNGATIYMAHNSGPGLHFFCPTTNSPVWRISDLMFVYTGSGSGVNAVEFDAMDYGTTSKLQFFNFNTPGSWALLLNGAEQDTFIDTDIEYGGISGNGVYLQNGSTADTFVGFKANNVEAAIHCAACEAWFYSPTIQGAHATHPIVIDQTAGMASLHVHNAHTEANGDGTSNASLFYIIMSNYTLIGFEVEDSTLNFQSGHVFQFSGKGFVDQAKITGNEIFNPNSEGLCTGSQCTNSGISFQANNVNVWGSGPMGNTWWGPNATPNGGFVGPVMILTPSIFNNRSVNCGSGTEGAIFRITDATTTTLGAVVTGGGGSHHVTLSCNGTNWVVMSE